MYQTSICLLATDFDLELFIYKFLTTIAQTNDIAQIIAYSEKLSVCNVFIVVHRSEMCDSRSAGQSDHCYPWTTKTRCPPDRRQIDSCGAKKNLINNTTSKSLHLRLRYDVLGLCFWHPRCRAVATQSSGVAHDVFDFVLYTLLFSSLSNAHANADVTL